MVDTFASNTLSIASVIINHTYFLVYVNIEDAKITNPCVPTPCGPYSVCRVLKNRPVCSCVAGYIGGPPNCRPECIVNSECSQNKACLKNVCQDPCPGTCGQNTQCRVVNHNPICSCITNYVGDPFSHCTPEESKDACF